MTSLLAVPLVVHGSEGVVEFKSKATYIDPLRAKLISAPLGVTLNGRLQWSWL
jgi:hypothetical protein